MDPAARPLRSSFGCHTPADERALRPLWHGWPSQRMTARPNARRSVPPATLLLCIYVGTLILFPADFGIRMLGIVFSPARIALSLLVVVALAGRVLTLDVIRSEPRAILVGWAAFLISALATILLEPSPGAAPRLLSLAIEGAVVYFATRAVASDADSVQLVVTVAVVASLGLTVVSIVAGVVGLRYDSVLTVIGGGEAAPSVSGERFGFVRQQGSFPAALFFAIWLAAAAVIVLPGVLDRARLTVATTAVAWAVLVGGIAILTVSRIAVTGVFLIAGIYLWRWGHRRIAATALVIGFAIAVGFAGLSMGPTPPNSSATVSPQAGIASPSSGPSARPESYPTEAEILAGSNVLRLKALEAAVDAVRQKPAFGWGLLRAKEVVAGIGGAINYVDSSYLVVVIEMGIAGLLAFVGLIVSVFAASRAAWSNPVGMAIGLACLSILGMSTVAAYLNVSQGYATFWLLSALLVSAGTFVGRNPGQGISVVGVAPTTGIS
jgi:hypothetical protein